LSGTAGDATLLEGPEFVFRLIPETVTQRGIQQITLRVSGQPEKPAEFRFGAKSILQFNGDGSAIWSF
jgi:hypothetical protein